MSVHRQLILIAFVVVGIACGSPRRTETTPRAAKVVEPPRPEEPSADSASGPPLKIQDHPVEETSPSMQVHLIDVGQGAATLLEFSCGAVLIDTGREFNKHFDGTERLMNYLAAFFKRRADLNDTLELLLITHPHIDHARGMRRAAGESHQVGEEGEDHARRHRSM